MGCWNKTCGLSRLHIYAGDPVYVFVLEQNAINDDRCYTTALFSPLLLPFEADYNDYGGGENERGIALPYVMDGLARKLIEVEQGENKYHDIPVKREGFGAEQFFEAVHEGRLSVPNWKRAPTAVDFVMVRQDVVHRLMNTWEREAYVGEGRGTCGWDNNYIKYTFQDVLADVDPFLDKIQTVLDGEVDLDGFEDVPEEKRESIKRLRIRMSFYEGLGSVYEWKDRHQNKVSWYMTRDGSRYSRLVDSDELILEAMQNGNREFAREMLVCKLTGAFVDHFYSATRNIWTPGCHEGSQASDHDGYRALADTLVWALDEEKKRWDEDNEE